MFDFILSFVKNGADYLLCAESPFLAGQAPPRPFQGSEGFYREASSGPGRDLATRTVSVGVAQPCDSVRIGRTLYQRVFTGEVEALFLRALALAREERTGLRVLIRSWHEPEIHNLPWEFLHDGRRFLAQSIETPVVRSLEQPRPIREFRIDPPLRLLLTTSCPTQGSPLDIQGEEQRLRAAVSPLEDRAILVTEHQVSLERLRFLLFRARAQGRPFRVWHHAGHGHSDVDGFSLALTKPDGSVQRVTVGEIEAVLAPCEEIRLAVLNTCSSATAAGLATALANLNVPAVIGFRESILDRSALVFAEALYQGLTETTLERAVSRARLELRDAGYSAVDWSFPMLFARTTAAGPWL